MVKKEQPPWATRPKAEINAILKEFNARQMEALSVYEPLPFQERYHACNAKEVALVKGNQVGGSLAGFAEDARAVCNRDPYKKYPEKNGVLVCLGYGERHIGLVIHRYLFRPGAFSIIQDTKTKLWRPFRPWHRDEERNGMLGDQGREKESMPCPPLIPRRMIEGKIAYTKRAQNIFAEATLKNGWKIIAGNSKGDFEHLQGFQCNLYHIDEDLAKAGWWNEAVARCSIPNGLLRWTAMPHQENEELNNLIQRAEDQEGTESPESVLIRATVFDNPYLPRKSVEQNIRLWKSAGEDVYRQRALGEVTTESVRMYPDFNIKFHDFRKWDTPACITLKESDGQVPEGWTRYLAVDPGHARCAVLFAAIPPDNSHVYFYDEIYLAQADAVKFGQAMQKKAANTHFQAFLIDSHGGRLRDIGGGRTPREQYSAQLTRYDIKSEETGFEFYDGNDDVASREMCLRYWLRFRDDGTPIAVVNTAKCPNLCRELTQLKKKFVDANGRRVIVDEKNPRMDHHLVDTAEYLAAHGCRYIKPPSSARQRSWIDDLLEQREQHRQLARMLKGKSSGRCIVLGPRGSDE